MPTYEYVCRACGRPLEVVQSFSDAALSVCPNCGGELRKVFGNVGIVLKGSGFYKTDNRSGSAKTPSSEPSEPKSTEPAQVSSDSSSTKESSSTSPDKPSSSASESSKKPADSKVAASST